MKKGTRRLMSILLTLVMALSLLPTAALAESTYTITLVADESRGTVTGGGTYNVGDTVTLTATAKEGYIFDGWYEDGIKLYLPSGTFVAERDRTLEARFKIAIKTANAEITFPVGGEHPDLTPVSSDPAAYTVTLNYWYQYSGSYSHVDADDTFEAGKKYALRLEFTANEGYAFDDTVFTVNGEYTYSYGASYMREIRVPAVQDPDATYTLTVKDGLGSGEYSEWDRVTTSAAPPADNMGFREWFGLDGLEILEVVGTYQARLSPEVTFRMPAKDLEITASYGINKVTVTATGNILPKLGESITVDPVFDLHNDDLKVNTGGSCWRYSTDGSYWYGPSELADKTFRQGYWQYDFRMQTVGDALISNPCTVTVNGEVWSTAGSNVATQIFADSPVYYLDAEGNVLPGLVRIKNVTATCDSFPAALNIGYTLGSVPSFACTTTPDDVFVYAYGEWQKKDGEEWKTVFGYTEAGGIYRYKTSLRMSNYNSTHTLDDAVTLKVNGVEWTVDHSTHENWGLEDARVTVYSPAMEARLPALTQVEILGFNPPTPDVTFDSETRKLYKTKIPEDAIYYIISHSWYCEDGSSIVSDTLEGGKTYRYRVQFGLIDAENNRFPDSVDEISVTVNGSSEAYVVEKKYAMNGSQQMLRCEVLFTCAGETPDTTPVRPEGDGTASNPFEIGTVGQLYWFEGFVNGSITAEDLTIAPEAACARLINDITVNPYLLACIATRNPGLADWTPIGMTTGYSGTFDGQGHTISGIYCDLPGTVEADYVGFFGTLAPGGSIRGLTLADTYVCAPAGKDDSKAGGIVGSVEEGARVDNCHFGGMVTTGDQAGRDTLGGIAAVNCGEIRNCTVKGIVIGYAKNAMGGIVGYMVKGTVSGCVNEAEVKNLVPTSGRDSDAVGGIVGILRGTIRDCCNKGTINGNDAGGIAGDVMGSDDSGTMILRCWNGGKVDSGAGIAYWLSYDGVIIKNCYNIGRVYCGIIDGFTGTGHSVTYCHNKGEITSGGSPISAHSGEGITFASCFYLANEELDSIDGTSAQDDNRFSDWKLQIVTQRLNAGDNAGNWVQGDICPVLTKAYPLTVIGGTGSGSYPEGTSVTISAAIPANSLFRSWTGLDGLEITEGAAGTADVTFTMPAGALTVTAVFEEIVLTQIVVSTPPTTTAYDAGDAFDPTGMVITAYYSNHTHAIVEDYTVTDGESLAADQTSVTISYTEGGVTKTATQAISIRKYRLFVTGGTGTGNYAKGTELRISAYTAPAGQTFDYWEVQWPSGEPSELVFTSGSNLNASTVTFLMPADSITLVAHYRYVEYSVTVEGGTLQDGSTSGRFKMGDEVIVAPGDPPEGMMFVGWEFYPDRVRWGWLEENCASFSMPNYDVQVRAVFVEAALTVDAMCDFTLDDGEVTEVVKVKVEHLDTVEGLDLSVGAMLIVAQYSDNDDFGKMMNIYTCPVTEDGIYDTEVFIYDEEEFYYYRVFLVDGKTWKPLYESLRRWGAGD